MKDKCIYRNRCNKAWCWFDKDTGSSNCPEAERIREIAETAKTEEIIDLSDRLWYLFLEWVYVEYVKPGMSEIEIDNLFNDEKIRNKFRKMIANLMGYVEEECDKNEE